MGQTEAIDVGNKVNIRNVALMLLPGFPVFSRVSPNKPPNLYDKESFFRGILSLEYQSINLSSDPELLLITRRTWD